MASISSGAMAMTESSAPRAAARPSRSSKIVSMAFSNRRVACRTSGTWYCSCFIASMVKCCLGFDPIGAPPAALAFAVPLRIGDSIICADTFSHVVDDMLLSVGSACARRAKRGVGARDGKLRRGLARGAVQTLCPLPAAISHPSRGHEPHKSAAQAQRHGVLGSQGLRDAGASERVKALDEQPVGRLLCRGRLSLHEHSTCTCKAGGNNQIAPPAMARRKQPLRWSAHYRIRTDCAHCTDSHRRRWRLGGLFVAAKLAQSGVEVTSVEKNSRSAAGGWWWTMDTTTQT